MQKMEFLEEKRAFSQKKISMAQRLLINRVKIEKTQI